ncbi:hypothetical protein BpHYR1_048821 [Brachionus plicatilis]|uniref:Uncharacterized protein n=1 Tax=Brachionus plicatilis TaxID=10195 RepID=A0A3M7QY26_BRAPC|nr:hypothetical protein BpHYR1_048821 [Brachionus plicatilis]
MKKRFYNGKTDTNLKLIKNNYNFRLNISVFLNQKLFKSHNRIEKGRYSKVKTNFIEDLPLIMRIKIITIELNTEFTSLEKSAPRVDLAFDAHLSLAQIWQNYGLNIIGFGGDTSLTF